MKLCALVPRHEDVWRSGIKTPHILSLDTKGWHGVPSAVHSRRLAPPPTHTRGRISRIPQNKTVDKHRPAPNVVVQIKVPAPV
jgi:hypothetical protein